MAILRTADNLGVQNVDIIEAFERFDFDHTNGKWLTLRRLVIPELDLRLGASPGMYGCRSYSSHRWHYIGHCMQQLRESGYTIFASDLTTDALPISETDFRAPPRQQAVHFTSDEMAKFAAARHPSSKWNDSVATAGDETKVAVDQAGLTASTSAPANEPASAPVAFESVPLAAAAGALPADSWKPNRRLRRRAMNSTAHPLSSSHDASSAGAHDISDADQGELHSEEDPAMVRLRIGQGAPTSLPTNSDGPKIALIFGNENRGVSKYASRGADYKFMLPMKGL